jgi:hypothetical protein
MFVTAIEAKDLLIAEISGGSRTKMRDTLPEYVIREAENETAKLVVMFPDGLPSDVDPTDGIALIDNMSVDDLPTREVNGVQRPVSSGNYKRKLSKQHKALCDNNVMKNFEAMATVLGFPNAKAVKTSAGIIIRLDGFPAEGGI